MSEETPREQAFWKLVQALDESNVLPYVMFIGTWAEWLYADLLPKSPDGSDHQIDIGKTYDIDVYFRERFLEIDGAEQLISIMQSAGFVRGVDYKEVFFDKHVEVEFLASSAGIGRGVYEIPSIGIRAEHLDHLEVLKPAWVEKRGYKLCIPTPASYVAQKLLINPDRRPESKRDADIRKVRLLLVIMESLTDQMADLKRLLENLGENEEATIRNVAAKNNLHLP